MTPLLIRLDPRHVAKLDELRGDVPRVAFIRGRLVEALDAVSRKVTWDERQDVTVWTPAPTNRAGASKLDIPVGPQPFKPNLKKR